MNRQMVVQWASCPGSCSSSSAACKNNRTCWGRWPRVRLFPAVPQSGGGRSAERRNAMGPSGCAAGQRRSSATTSTCSSLPPDREEATVLRAVDGELVGTRKVPRLGRRQRLPDDQQTTTFARLEETCLATLGRNLLLWWPEGHRRVLTLVDPLEGRDLWAGRKFSGNARACVVEDEAVGVMEPERPFRARGVARRAHDRRPEARGRAVLDGDHAAQAGSGYYSVYVRYPRPAQCAGHATHARRLVQERFIADGCTPSTARKAPMAGARRDQKPILARGPAGASAGLDFRLSACTSRRATADAVQDVGAVASTSAAAGPRTRRNSNNPMGRVPHCGQRRAKKTVDVVMQQQDGQA